MPIPPATDYPLQFRFGPYGPSTFFSTFVLAEGEPYEPGIPVGDGSFFEMLYLGGHDATNKLIGGGFQVLSAAPTFTAPVGAACMDTSMNLWLSNGSGWQLVGSGSAGTGDDEADDWDIDGGTWT